MQYSLYINQLFIANHPACNELDIIDVAIFDCVRKLIAGNWGEKKLEGGTMWANVSVSKILQEMPLLRNGKGEVFKQRAIHGRISKLCDAGLLQKWENNQVKATSFMALGSLAREYDSYTRPLHLDANPIAPECKPPLHVDANNKNTIQNTLSNSTDPDSQANGKPLPIKKPKTTGRRISYEDSCRFYADQLNALMPSAKEGSPAPPPDVQGYGRMVEWMKTGDVEIPNGMRDTVMRMGEQLSFPQVQKILGDMGLTWYQIKHYLVRLHGYTENKNTSIYLTIKKWYSDDVLSNKVPPRNAPINGVPSSPSKLSAPKEVHQ